MKRNILLRCLGRLGCVIEIIPTLSTWIIGNVDYCNDFIVENILISKHIS